MTALFVGTRGRNAGVQRSHFDLTLASVRPICDAFGSNGGGIHGRRKSANGKTAIVTGAGTGIGKATAAALLAEGWNTVFVGRRKNLLDEAVAEAKTGAAGARALAVACDVTKPDKVDEMFETIAEAFGRVDLLFNNAGMGFKTATIDEVPVEVWNEVVAVNLTGSFLVARGAFAAMRRQKPMGGRIINNGSISAHTPRPGSIPYTATKHAITGLTKTLALDGRPFDIACGQIDIGNAQTSIAPLTSACRRPTAR